MQKQGKKPRTVLAWALWVPRHDGYVPIREALPALYPSRRAAKAAGTGGFSRVIRVKVLPVMK